MAAELLMNKTIATKIATMSKVVSTLGRIPPATRSEASSLESVCESARAVMAILLERSWDCPLLVRAAVAVPDLKLRAVGGVERRVVEASARYRVDQHPVDAEPLLVGAAIASPQLDQGAVGGAGVGDVQAGAVDPDGSVGLHRPVLRGRAVAIPHLHVGTVGA